MPQKNTLNEATSNLSQESKPDENLINWIPAKTGLVATCGLIQLTKNKPRSKYKKYEVKIFLHPALLSKVNIGKHQQQKEPVNKKPSVTEDELNEIDRELTKALQTQSNAQDLAQRSSDNIKAIVNDYRLMPKNLVPMLGEELKELDACDDLVQTSYGVSLLDPLTQIKIKLPVKSLVCNHFQCFDYETFCIFNKISNTVKDVTVKNLKRQNIQKLKEQHHQVQQLQQQQQKQRNYINHIQTNYHQNQINRPQSKQPQISFINNPTDQSHVDDPDMPQVIKISPYYPPPKSKQFKSKFVTPNYHNCPQYRCPICEREFTLSSLKISDTFNFFVKNSPINCVKIEILDKEKYRMVNETELGSRSHSTQPGDIVDLSDDDTGYPSSQKMKLDNLIEKNLNLGYRKLKTHYFNPFEESTNEMGEGQGTADDPITL